MPEEKRQYLVERDKESYYNPQEWLEEFLDDEGAFTMVQKQPPEAFCKKEFFYKIRKFHGKTPVLESPFIEVAGLRSLTLLKRDSSTGVSPTNLQNI